MLRDGCVLVFFYKRKNLGLQSSLLKIGGSKHCFIPIHTMSGLLLIMFFSLNVAISVQLENWVAILVQWKAERVWSKNTPTCDLKMARTQHDMSRQLVEPPWIKPHGKSLSMIRYYWNSYKYSIRCRYPQHIVGNNHCYFIIYMYICVYTYTHICIYIYKHNVG